MSYIFSFLLYTKLLSENKIEIKNYLEKNKLTDLDLEKFNAIRELNDIYMSELLRQKNIEAFCKKFIAKKYDIIENIDNLQRLKNTNSVLVYNPTYYRTIPPKYMEDPNALNIPKLKIKYILEILLQYPVVNTSLPSIGLLTDYVLFIKDVINIDHGDSDVANRSLLSLLPMLKLNIGETLSDILLNSDNIYTINFNNDQMKQLIIRLMNNIQVRVKDIFYIDYDLEKKPKINVDYIIPYILDTRNSKDKTKIISMTKSDIDKIKDYKQLINHNNKIVTHVINQTFKIDKTIGARNLDKDNYKNVLACFLFNIIRIICDICKKYIDSIDTILKDLVDIREKRPGQLNIRDAFQYTTNLNISLYKFKIILFNNFYQLFLPTHIQENGYGMMKDDYNCYIPESMFMNDFQNLFNKFPIIDCGTDSSKAAPYIITDEKILSFLKNIKEKYDIYDSKQLLDSGGFIFSKKLMKIALNILYKYYELVLCYSNFVLYIIDKLQNNLKNIKYFPPELIDISESNKGYMTNYNLTKNTKEKLEKKLLSNFELSIEKSTAYLKQLINLKRLEDPLLSDQEETLALCISFYYQLTQVLLKYSETIKDIKLKSPLLQKYKEKQQYYENVIKKYVVNI